MIFCMYWYCLFPNKGFWSRPFPRGFTFHLEVWGAGGISVRCRSHSQVPPHLPPLMAFTSFSFSIKSFLIISFNLILLDKNFPVLWARIPASDLESILIFGMTSPFSPSSPSSYWLNLLWPFVGPSGEWVFRCVQSVVEETQPSITDVSLTSHSFSTMSLSCWGEEEGTVMFQTHW